MGVPDALQTALDDPEVAIAEYDSQMMGRGTFEQAVDRFGNLDLVIHSWDLARAAGLDERLDPEDVHWAYEAPHGRDAAFLRGVWTEGRSRP